MKLDRARSRVAVYTFAEGMLSALAHDLEIVAGDVEGEAEEDRVELRFAIAALHVSGAIKRGKLLTEVLSSGDRAAIDQKIRDEILPGTEVIARGARDRSCASIEITTPRGMTRASCAVSLTMEDGMTRAKGSAEVSLNALGCPPVRGPLGAFRVKDAVRVDFDLVFV